MWKINRLSYLPYLSKTQNLAQVLSIDDKVPGGNVRIKDMIDRKMGSCIGIKRLRVEGRTGYPEVIPTHVYIFFSSLFGIE